MVFSINGYAEPLENAKASVMLGAYQDAAIEHLLESETSQDAKESILTRLIESNSDAVLLTKLHCKRGKLRVIHTHLPKGVDDLQACVDGLAAETGIEKKLLEEKQNELERAKQKYEYTKNY